ncbi:MAG: endonuclease/exonuclease/phosphatase family protein [Nanoarchaeota archaeon]
MSLDDLVGKHMQVKVMNYNVLHGFHSLDHKPENERLTAAQEVVRQEDPDILVLTEACYGAQKPGGGSIFMDYGKLFGFANYRFAKRGDAEWGSAILSKYPITSMQNNERGMQNHVRTTIDLKGMPLMLDVAHPHPSVSEEDKAKYFKEVVLARHSNPYVLAGDFNSLSPQDKYERADLIAGLHGQVRYPEAVVDSWLKRLAVPVLTSVGLVDTYRSAHPHSFDYTIPTDYLSKDKRSGVRIDYIFASPDIKVKDSYVIQNALTNKASDHHPVVAVLDIKK